MRLVLIGCTVCVPHTGHSCPLAIHPLLPTRERPTDNRYSAQEQMKQPPTVTRTVGG
jgi:hypothetical protein